MNNTRSGASKTRLPRTTTLGSLGSLGDLALGSAKPPSYLLRSIDFIVRSRFLIRDFVDLIRGRPHRRSINQSRQPKSKSWRRVCGLTKKAPRSIAAQNGPHLWGLSMNSGWNNAEQSSTWSPNESRRVDYVFNWNGGILAAAAFQTTASCRATMLSRVRMGDQVRARTICSLEGAAV